MRLATLLLTLVLMTAMTTSVDAQFRPEPERIAQMRSALVGKQVRVGHGTRGVVRDVTVDALLLDEGDHLRRIPLAELRELEVVTPGGRDPARALLGAAGGVAVGAMFASSLDADAQRAPIVGLGALVGFGLGAAGGRDQSNEPVDLGLYLPPRLDLRLLGRKVRLRRLSDPEQPLEGRVVVSNPEELVIKDRRGRLVAVERSEIYGADVYRYRPMVSLLGAAGGLTAGVVGGFFLGAGLEIAARGSEEPYTGLAGGLLGSAVLGVVGLVVGFQAGDTWTPLHRNGGGPVRLSLVPGGPGGMGLTVHGTF